eukprot:403341580
MGGQCREINKSPNNSKRIDYNPSTPTQQKQQQDAGYLQMKRQSVSPIRKLEFQNISLAGLQSKFNDKSPVNSGNAKGIFDFSTNDEKHQSPRPQTSQNAQNNNNLQRCFGNPSNIKSAAVSPRATHSFGQKFGNYFTNGNNQKHKNENTITETKSNIFPTASQKENQVSQQSMNYSPRAGGKNPMEQQMKRKYDEIKRSMMNEYKQKCIESLRQMNKSPETNSKSSTQFAFRNVTNWEKKQETKQIRDHSQKSGIMCLPGSHSYKTNIKTTEDQKEISKSPIREALFNKRNRSLIFGVSDKNESRDRTISPDFYQNQEKRVEHAIRKQQLTSAQIQDINSIDPMSHKFMRKQSPSKRNNISDEVRSCINSNQYESDRVRNKIKNGESSQTSNQIGARGISRQLLDGIMDQRKSSFVIS